LSLTPFCGNRGVRVAHHYYSLFDKQQVAEHFHVRHTAYNVGIIAPNYNVAPGDPQPVIRRSRGTGERELVMMRWSSAEGVSAALTGPRAAAEEDGAATDAFDRECQKSQLRQRTATVAAAATRIRRGWVTMPF
jgi:putative SOS response-associated peptidase YedK